MDTKINSYEIKYVYEYKKPKDSNKKISSNNKLESYEINKNQEYIVLNKYIDYNLFPSKLYIFN